MAAFTNRATLSYSGGVTNSNIVTGEIVEVLSVTKNATKSTYGSDDTVTYVISIRNTGTTPITGITVSDNLGAYAFNQTTLTPLEYIDGTLTFYLNGVLQTAPTVAAGPPLVITGITIPAGGNAIIIYEAKTNKYAPLGIESEIKNTVTVSGNSISAPVTAEETIAAAAAPDLAITKALSPEKVLENGQLTYTFTIQNFGNTEATAANDIVITDTFNPILNPITVTFNGAAWTAPESYTYDANTGEFSTVAGKITVPAATYTQNPETGVWTLTPGASTLVITGTV